MADPVKKAEAAPSSATLTISEMPGGTRIDVAFSEPFRVKNPSEVQTLAIAALDHMRGLLKDLFGETKEELKVVPQQKPH
ncbi:MAG: hypothetical protein LAT63_17020 [Marinobacter sp.]|nr:hypothetical protein [Marinobacter sp.]